MFLYSFPCKEHGPTPEFTWIQFKSLISQRRSPPPLITSSIHFINEIIPVPAERSNRRTLLWSRSDPFNFKLLWTSCHVVASGLHGIMSLNRVLVKKWLSPDFNKKKRHPISKFRVTHTHTDLFFEKGILLPRHTLWTTGFTPGRRTLLM